MTPDSYPTPSQWVNAVTQLRNRLMQERKRAFPVGTIRGCPVCSKKALESRDDVMRETIVGAMALIHHNLHGARCSNCGAEFLESYEEIALEEAGPQRILSDYHAKITSVSGRNLGTYWPKDVVRAMDLHSQDSLRVQILDQDTMLIARRHEHDEG
jgi:YgiT-type zinc finger domain-containing protein